MTEARIVGVAPMYAGAVGVWRVSVGFAGNGFATFAHRGPDAPRVGDTWLLRAPELCELIERPGARVPDRAAETRAPEGLNS